MAFAVCKALFDLLSRLIHIHTLHRRAKTSSDFLILPCRSDGAERTIEVITIDHLGVASLSPTLFNFSTIDANARSQCASAGGIGWMMIAGGWSPAEVSVLADVVMFNMTDSSVSVVPQPLSVARFGAKAVGWDQYFIVSGGRYAFF